VVLSTLVVTPVALWRLINYYYFFDPHGGSKITKENYEICLAENLLWPVVINKTIMHQNRIKTLHHNGNPLE